MTSVDPRLTRARDALDAAALHAVASLPPSVMARELAELRHVLRRLVDLVDEGPAATGDAERLAAIRAVLAAFDWERDDRQYALEEIERIATGDLR